MKDKIESTEDLYRAIKRSKPSWLDDDGKPTSAMFKDIGGNSVDRDDKRELNEIIRFMDEGIFKRRLKGVVRINAGDCMNEPICAKVEAAPSETNPYHANIYIDGLVQALMLADSSEVVYLDTTMEWTGR